MDERHRKALIHKFFVAKMWWDPGAKDRGAVVLQWGGGRLKVVPREDLDGMGWVEGF